MFHLCSYIWFFKSFHTLNCCEVAGLSCESWCITVLVIGVFSAAAAGPAELFRITMSPPRCERFFATSALESTSSVTDSESTLRKQIEEWQVQHQKTAKMPPHVQWLLSLAASCCRGLEDTFLAFVASLGPCFSMKLNVLHELPYLGELRIGSV